MQGKGRWALAFGLAMADALVGLAGNAPAQERLILRFEVPGLKGATAAPAAVPARRSRSATRPLSPPPFRGRPFLPSFSRMALIPRVIRIP